MSFLIFFAQKRKIPKKKEYKKMEDTKIAFVFNKENYEIIESRSGHNTIMRDALGDKPDYCGGWVGLESGRLWMNCGMFGTIPREYWDYIHTYFYNKYRRGFKIMNSPKGYTSANWYGRLKIAQEKNMKKKIEEKRERKPSSEYDQEQLQKGIKVEKEHTRDKDVAEMIAKDHLQESGDIKGQKGGKYYDRLEEVEKKIKKEIGK